MNDVVEFLVKVWAWFKALPILGPLLKLAYSRKAMISAAIVTFILKYLPGLAPVGDELNVVIAQAILIALVAIANILGIAIEDAAEKRNAFHVLTEERVSYGEIEGVG